MPDWTRVFAVLGQRRRGEGGTQPTHFHLLARPMADGSSGQGLGLFARMR